MIAPDCMIDPPEDEREVVAICAECGNQVLQYEDVLYSHTLQQHFCNNDCLTTHFDVVETYYE